MQHILILCGGKSAEHEISILSAKNIVKNVDRTRFRPIIVVISRGGSWYLINEEILLSNIKEYNDTLNIGELCSLMHQPQQTILITLSTKQIIIDLVFPLVHGPYGEDGTLQGFLELMNIPYVGSGVTASAINMDKSLTKQLLAYANVPIVPYLVITDANHYPLYAQACYTLNSTILFVKPAIMGSSIGVSKVTNSDEYDTAINMAFQYGFKVLVEQYIECREIECAVLGNTQPKASCLGEIIPKHEFYTYEAKYFDPNGAKVMIPAQIANDVSGQICEMAIQCFKLFNCKGLSRVDFFLSTNNEIYVNELNTMPGFTNTSLYPMLWQASGLSYKQLITQLIDFSISHHQDKSNISLH